MADNNVMPLIGWALSAYGAVLSTVLAILHWQRDKGRFSISPEILHIRIQPPGEKTVVWRLMEIVNVGRRPLYLADYGIILTGGTIESMRERDRETEFPLRFDEGQKHRSMSVEDKFASHEIKRLWARDTTGKMYYSANDPFGKE